jgi:chemotaxis protein methyltransferase WspC
MNQTPPSVVERLLAERIGLDPSSVGDKLIARGVLARMTALGLRSKSEYERILIEQPDELQALVEEVVVAESWFFRDERPFEVLARFAVEGWLGEPGRPLLTVLSLPCASGEEPYSIAITLLEAGLAADRFRVDAVDVSARSIARAIAGVYGSNAFRGMASDRRSSYFREQNRAFTLEPAVRSTVRFHLGNVLDPALFADRSPFDAVFCRNLLIYLDDDAKARAFAGLARLVSEGGLLFLGHADRLELLENTPFEPMAEKGSFGFRKEANRTRNRQRQGGDAPSSGPLRPSVSFPPSGPLPPCGGGLGWGVAWQDQRRPEPDSKGYHHATPPHPNPPPQGGRESAERESNPKARERSGGRPGLRPSPQSSLHSRPANLPSFPQTKTRSGPANQPL